MIIHDLNTFIREKKQAGCFFNGFTLLSPSKFNKMHGISITTTTTTITLLLLYIFPLQFNLYPTYLFLERKKKIIIIISILFSIYAKANKTCNKRKNNLNYLCMHILLSLQLSRSTKKTCYAFDSSDGFKLISL